jgi:hypothetical protein
VSQGQGIGGHHSHRMMKDEWLTPRNILNALGPFDLDPCAPIDRPWDIAAHHYTIEDDGLVQPWTGLVWCNPVYGNQAKLWLNKLSSHPEGGIALIFARTETEMFVSEIWEKADALLFLYGRLHFYHVNGERATSNSGAPSVLVGYKQFAIERLRNSNLPGAFIDKWRSIPKNAVSAA